MVKSKALRKFLVPFGIFLVLVTVAIIKKMRTVAAGEGTTVVLCHVPPGNPENAHTIEVGESAVEAHLEHGDYLGECEGDDGNDDGDDDGGAENVTLCHVPPGNPENAHTIEVGAAAVDAHIEHGDYLGECEAGEGNGDDDGGAENVTLCHIPPGNPENAHTIEVGAAAVAAHLAHGDVLGACEGDEGGGSNAVTICHIPSANPENAHTIEVPASAVPAHLAHGDTLGECPEEGDEAGGDSGGDDDGDEGDDGAAGEDGDDGDDGDDGGDGDDDGDDGGDGNDGDGGDGNEGDEGDEGDDGDDGDDDGDDGDDGDDDGDDGGDDGGDGGELTGALAEDSGDEKTSRPDADDGDTSTQQALGGDGDKNSLFIQMQPGATGAFDGNIDGELNICGYITPVSFTMMFAGLLLMRVGTGRRRF